MQRLMLPLAGLLLASPAAAQPFALEQPTIAGGGGEVSAGSLTLRATINPQAGGRLEGGAFTLTGGLFPLDRFDSGCPADVNNDGVANGSDFFAWVNAFGSQSPACDVNGDGACTGSDFFAWVAAFGIGCP